MTTTQLDVFVGREWITVHFAEDKVVSAPEPLRFMDAKRYNFAKALDFARRKGYLWLKKTPKYQEQVRREQVDYYRGYA